MIDALLQLYTVSSLVGVDIFYLFYTLIAKLTKERSRGTNAFVAQFGELESYDKLMEFVEFIVDNTYIANHINHVYKQTIGIPMGTNCAPEIATLVL